MSRFFVGTSEKINKANSIKANIYKGEEYKTNFTQFNSDCSVKPSLDENFSNACKSWESAYKKEIESFVVSTNNFSDSYLPLGIAKKFQKIRSTADVNDFAAKYGVLGSGRLTKIQNFVDFFENTIEPVEVWYEYANKVRGLVELYDEIKNCYETGDELNLDYTPINQGIDGYVVSWKSEQAESTFFSRHCSESEIGIEPNEVKKNSLNIGRSLLITAIKQQIDSEVYVHPSTQNTPNAPLGITVTENKYTTNLISAIFYDLWLLLVDDIPVSYCAHCNDPFIPKRKSGKYCSDSCKTMFNRKKSMHPS